MLVDLGYMLFYRYHATMKNLQLREEISNLTEDSLLSLFKKHLEQQIDKLIKKYRLTNETILFCKDCRQETIWRKDLYPEYKANRGVATELIRKLQEVLFATVKKYGQVLEIPHLEADDITYLASQAIFNNNKKSDIYVLANDRDYLQIHGITLVDASGKEIKGTGDPEKDLWIKILMGDKSDNIPPVCKGVGKKTAQKLAENIDERNIFIIKKGCLLNLQRNENLIRMDLIPKAYVEQFYSTYKFVIYQ